MLSDARVENGRKSSARRWFRFWTVAREVARRFSAVSFAAFLSLYLMTQSSASR
jgi:hypothetical protein